MQNKTLNYEGKKIAYRTSGSGPMVVLLHGFGEESSVWKGQYEIFSRHQLLVPDLPGSGQSEAIDDMSMEGLADAVKAMIDAEQHGLPLTPSLGGAGRGQVVLIGHSMGGYITLAFAEKYPQYLRSFGLFHSTAYADSEEKKETRRKGIRFIEEHGAAEFLKTATPNLYAPDNRKQHPEWIEEHLAAIRNFSGASLVSYYASMIERPHRTAVLKQSQVPVLFVIGRHDAAVPLQDSLQQCHLPQIAYIHILENSGHMGMKEELNEASQILSQFVNTTEKTA